VTDAVTAPALTGLWKPTILLPTRSLEKLDDEALRFVLLHELAHLRRRDLWTNWILAVLRSLHWFNPFVWWAFHRLRVEAERAADPLAGALLATEVAVPGLPEPRIPLPDPERTSR
jgi:bla regulator protein BlaR1